MRPPGLVSRIACSAFEQQVQEDLLELLRVAVDDGQRVGKSRSTTIPESVSG